MTEVRLRGPDIPVPSVEAAVGKAVATSTKFEGPAASVIHQSMPGTANVLCNLLPAGGARDACLAAAGLTGGGQPAGCPEGQIRVADTCVALGDAWPGGDPLLTEAGGQAVEGSFGIPAYTPTIKQRTVRECGPRLVLGFDNLCYPKAVLPRRSKFRKWRGEVRPIISRRDTVALRRAGAAKDRLMEAAKDAGLSVSKSPRRKSAPRAAAPVHGGTLRVVEEHHH